MIETGKNKKIWTAIIVDDHPIYRQGLKASLSGIDWLRIVDEAGDGEEAQQKIDRLTPDLVLLDLAMPGLDGLSVLERMKSRHPGTGFIILTSYDDQAYRLRAQELGALGFIVKEGPEHVLIECLETIRKGGSTLYLAPDERRPVLPSRQASPSLDRLTDMEKRVLQQVASFKTSKEIAEELGISHRTVQNHRHNICNKLRLKGAHQLLGFARDHFGQP